MLNQVRSKFLEYFKSKNHLLKSSFSLIPENDESLLFVNAGMAPLKKYFLNLEVPPAKNLVTSQYCLRVGGKHNDLKDVGYTKRHHTFFEMLGNFSFGGYFKEESINISWKFLVENLKLDIARLYVTIHPKDDDAWKFWSRHIASDRIIKLEGNVWSMGDVGPWGYCSEIFYDLQVGAGDFEDGDRYLEIWNLVFMEFCTDGQNNKALPKACIDTGMGLERIVAVLENKSDTYDISFFVAQLSVLGVKEHSPATKIFLDHLRSAAHLIQAGVVPSPNVRGYVLRQLLRRMLKAGMDLKIDNYTLVITEVLTNWSDVYSWDIEKIIAVILKEKDSFFSTYTNGLKYFHEFFDKSKHLSGEELFLLHDRHGMTEEIVRDLVRENNGTADFDDMEACFMKGKPPKEELSEVLQNLPLTKYVEADVLEAKILAVCDDLFVTDKTCFYAEGGGQIGDSGMGKTSKGEFKIITTTKNSGVYLHKFEVVSGKIEVGDVIALELDMSKNQRIRAHHSCVHLTQHALDVLYQDVKQMGSYVSDKKFRVDVSWESDKDIDVKQVENYIQNMIDKKIQTEIKHMPLKEAVETGAKAFFTYDSVVRVVRMEGAAELCGGSHVANTSELIAIKILKISPVKAGVKRVEGIAGQAYLDYMRDIHQRYLDVLDCLEVDPDQLMSKLKKMIEKKDAKPVLLASDICNNLKFGVVKALDSCSIEDVEAQFKLDITCLIVEKGAKSSFCVKTKMGVEAKPIALAIANFYNYKGVGGKGAFAQTGGEKPADYSNLANILKDSIKQIA